MKVCHLHIIALFLFFGQQLYTQRVEVMNLVLKKVVNGVNLRFDKINFENDNHKKAASKGVILHDKKGYLWIQSELENQAELVRYDGNYSKSFKGKFWSLFQELLSYKNVVDVQRSGRYNKCRSNSAQRKPAAHQNSGRWH